jgi:large conductance mechanosensitive channel
MLFLMTSSVMRSWQLPMRQLKACSRMTGAKLSGKLLKGGTMSFFREFREFALRGNVIDMAVGIIVGAAFGKIISSLVGDVILPPIGLLLGGVDFSRLAVTLKAATAEQPAVVLGYGRFIQTVVDFLIIALAIFVLIVKPVNMLKRRQPAAPPPGPSNEERLLTEIRDLLRSRAG